MSGGGSGGQRREQNEKRFARRGSLLRRVTRLTQRPTSPTLVAHRTSLVKNDRGRCVHAPRVTD